MLKQFNIISLGNSAINKVGLLSVGRIQQVFEGPGTGSTLVYLNPLKQTDNFVKITVTQTPGQVNALIAGSSMGAKSIVNYNNGTQNQTSIITVDNIAWAFSTGSASCEFYYESQLTIPLQRLTVAMSLTEFQTLVNGTNESATPTLDVVPQNGVTFIGNTPYYNGGELDKTFDITTIDQLKFVASVLRNGNTQGLKVTVSASNPADWNNDLGEATLEDTEGICMVAMTPVNINWTIADLTFTLSDMDDNFIDSKTIRFIASGGSGSGSGGGGSTLNATASMPYSISGTITLDSPGLWKVDPTTTSVVTTDELGLISILSGKWNIQATSPTEYVVDFVPGPSTALINGVVPVTASSIIVNSASPPNTTDFAGLVVSGTISY